MSLLTVQRGSAHENIYLDNNATTRLDPMVLEAMMPFLTDYYGNPSSIHDFGAPCRGALERARQQVASLLGARYDSEIIFTSCATEATSTAIHSAVALAPERREIITSAVEHPPRLKSANTSRGKATPSIRSAFLRRASWTWRNTAPC